MTAASVEAAEKDVSLEDRYQLRSGRIFISGIEALVRLTVEQSRLDRSRGLDTAVFVSGYPGSPLGGLDLELLRSASLLGDDVVFRPGVNEELAATAVAGTQLVGNLPGVRRRGVTGFWFGKNPGLDRAADAIRHGMLTGTSPLGGAVAWIGDDPMCKSSTLPSSCEPMARSLMMPLLVPGTVREILELGLHAVALSRFAGVWTGLRVVADVADAASTVDVTGLADEVPPVEAGRRFDPTILVGTELLDAERDLVEVRLPRAIEYSRSHRLNRIAAGDDGGRLGIVASGSSYATVLQALERLDIDAEALDRLGIRLVQVRMPWPLHHGDIRRLTAGLAEVLVVEDKLSFLEGLVKQALYGTRNAPRVLGKEDAEGRPFLPSFGALDADTVAAAIAALLPIEGRSPLWPATPARSARERLTVRPTAVRTPYFCSGCPHNSSTRTPDGALVGVGIGCHTMVALDEAGRGELVGVTQMGGEGGHWIGLAPFSADRHFFQNMGDGTFFHSGSLAVRAAIAARLNVTFKLLYNDAVAMTGGQAPTGRMGVAELTRWLAVEGARAVVVTTPDPAIYRGVRLDPIASVRHRDELLAVQSELARIAGVTVLIHDERCAAEERRLKKRGELPATPERAWINERVCEGCGDCGAVSRCLSVVPVETELGRKTQVHQTSCNQDFTCMKGDCPSFVLVTPRQRGLKRARPGIPVVLTEPRSATTRSDLRVRIVGIGGTGIVTASRVLQMAGHLDGWHVAGLDQTGLAQKGGPVVSDIRFSEQAVNSAVRAAAGSVDVLLACDALVASDPATLVTARQGHTVAVVDTAQVPTAAMVAHPEIGYPADAVGARLDAVTQAASNVRLPAQWIAERLFADSLPANMVVVGAAYQSGFLPLTARAIEQAIRLNGASVTTNLEAFAWGRAAIMDRDAVVRALSPSERGMRIEPRAERMLAKAEIPASLRQVLGTRASDLVGYQSSRYARRYLEEVLEIAALELERDGRVDLPVATAYAKQLHRLMAYKDEYEVARLHLDRAEEARMVEEFGPGARARVLLHPPVLRALGLKHKISLGGATRPVFKILHASRGLRATPLDPFGRSELRKLERALPGEYRELVLAGLARLRPDNVEAVVELVECAEAIRGYESVKLAGVRRFRTQAQALLAQLGSPPAQAERVVGLERTGK